MNDASILAEPPPSLAAARDREAAGDVAAADAIYARLYDQRAPDPAVLVAWSRLRRRAGDVPNADRMLDVAQRCGGGASVLVEKAAVLIDLRQGDQAGALLRQAAPGGRFPALDFQTARWETLHGRLPQAAAHFRAAMRADPAHLEARYGLARTLALMGQVDEAGGAYEALLKRDPGNHQILGELAWLRARQRRFAEALALYDRMAASGADTARDLARLAVGMMQICDWRYRDALTTRLATRMALVKPALLDSTALLAGSDNPALHRMMAERLAGAYRDASGRQDRPASRMVGPATRRLRVGYLGDFASLALPFGAAGVIAAHDREGFEVFFYRTGAEGSAQVGTDTMPVEHVRELGGGSAIASAARIASDEVDILVDLCGYTNPQGTAILCLRPAPLQVNFLGYQATQGAEWIDYAIADAIALPLGQEAHWTEQVVRLPHCAWSGRRPDMAADTDRVAQGLPADGTVFACFDDPVGISPACFASWMDALSRCDDAVLWLQRSNSLAVDNLRRMAAQAGIDGTRLVFAEPTSLERHIARHGCADLCLSAWHGGSPGVTADALWAGLPVLARPGESFGSRLVASQLHAVGLQSLIAPDIERYVALAAELADDKERCRALRARLLESRETASLFDGAGFARTLEHAYRIMAQRSRDNRPPAPFEIA